MIKIYRVAEETFLISAIRSNGLTTVRLGINPDINKDDILCDHVALSSLIRHDLGLEYEFINFTVNEFGYISVPQTAEKLKEGFKLLGAVKIPALDNLNFSATKRINPDEKLIFLFYKNRNITCTYQSGVVFDLKNELRRPYLQEQITLSNFKALNVVCNADPEKINLLTSDTFRDHYRKEIESELYSFGIVLGNSRVYATDLNSDANIPLDFNNDIPITFNYPIDNTLYLRTKKDIDFNTEIEISIKQNKSDLIKIPLQVYEKNAVSYNNFQYRCHSPYFENYVHQNLIRLEKFIRHGLINFI